MRFQHEGGDVGAAEAERGEEPDGAGPDDDD